MKNPWKSAIQYLWQIPQHLLALLLIILFQAKPCGTYRSCRLYRVRSFPGITLGRYILFRRKGSLILAHAYGHALQSRRLGWFYLPLIVLPALLHARYYNGSRRGYYRFYTERWADRLGQVKRL